jgi:hypothetical protein
VELNDTKIAMLRQSVDGTGRFIESLCNIREGIYKIKRAEWVESVDKIRKIGGDPESMKSSQTKP